MTAAINSSLETLCAKISENSLNYESRIRLFPSPGMAGQSVADIVSTALGSTVLIGGTNSTNRAALLASVKGALEFAGDESSYPNRAYLASKEFQDRKEEILKAFDHFISDAGQLISFWLKKGHPFYPVFWDFAFVIDKGVDSFVLIGSSSD